MTLIFEEKWDRTIADKDRKRIQEIYEENPIQEGKLQFVPIRVAFNHRNELLASVCILNGIGDWKLDDRLLSYFENSSLVATKRFSHKLTVPSHSAVPWTFIFPQNTMIRQAFLKNWSIS
ncbi:SLAP domain-containing protein [Guptibacillus hwajinpoensis]|uniref:SLAP domain-containing protein n=1 Tax=Guptibacillus hwajinpoensis TaxID=208199 RepID=UPI001CFCC3F5|nr:SLAP domain-containing protein [Pseudalkalibacillus hwajinpoensis]WLR57855.1 SLAP domain-containing protein [Pseudalkalibacillus hwajinpoensis]